MMGDYKIGLYIIAVAFIMNVILNTFILVF